MSKTLITTTVLLVLCLYFVSVSSQNDRGNALAANSPLARLAKNVNVAYRPQEEEESSQVLASESHSHKHSKHGKDKTHSIPIKKSYKNQPSDDHNYGHHSQHGLSQPGPEEQPTQGGVPPEYEKYIPEPYRKYAHPPDSSTAEGHVKIGKHEKHGKSGKDSKYVEETVDAEVAEAAAAEEEETILSEIIEENLLEVPEAQSSKVLADTQIVPAGGYSLFFLIATVVVFVAISLGAYWAYGKFLVQSDYQSVPTREVM